MENEVIIYEASNGELKHWGIKGMRWGVRRYQNPDGSLTALGKKRRGQASGTDKKSSEKPTKSKEEKQADKQAKKQANIEAARKKTAEKIEKAKTTIEKVKAKRMLKQEKNELKNLNKKIEQDKQDEKDRIKREKEAEGLKAKLLKSSDAAEIYKHRDLFTTAELNERLARIDTEKRLANAASSGKAKKTIFDHVDTGIKIGKKANEVYELKNTSLGKALMKQMGFKTEPDKSGYEQFLSDYTNTIAKIGSRKLKELSAKKNVSDSEFVQLGKDYVNPIKDILVKK